MKIKKLVIQNVKSFRDQVVVEFSDSLNLLIGPNAGGKSNLLDILAVMMRSLLPGYKIEPHHEHGVYFRLIQPSEAFPLGRVLDTFSGHTADQEIQITLSIESADVKNLSQLADRRGDLQDGLRSFRNTKDFDFAFLDSASIDSVEANRHVTYTIKNQNLQQPEAGSAEATFLKYLKNFELFSLLDAECNLGLNITSCYYYFSPFRGLGSSEVFSVDLSSTSYTGLLSKYFVATSRSGTSLAQFATAYLAKKRRRLEVEASESGYKEQWNKDPEILLLRETLGRLGYDWTLSLLDDEKNIYRSDLLFRGVKQDIELASSGEQEIINFILAIFARQLKEGMLVIDEPELHLHHQWQQQLLNVFFDLNKDMGNQVIVSTHSASFITPKSLPYVIRVFRDNERVSRIVPAPKTSDGISRSIFHIINAHNNQKMFFADIIVLVEGISDRIIFETLLRLFLDNAKGLQVIEVLEVHGKDNFPKYLEFLKTVKVRSFVIADLDYVLKIGNQKIQALFETNDEAINKKILKDKKSTDRKSLVKAIRNAIDTKDLAALEDICHYIEDRCRRLKPKLSAEEQESLDSFLQAQKGNNNFILRRGELEDYLPSDCSSLDQIIKLVEEQEFRNWLGKSWDSSEVQELLEIAKMIVGVDDEVMAKIHASLQATE